ncbi:MAG: DNA primase [Thermodesulfobacteriota bacterium]
MSSETVLQVKQAADIVDIIGEHVTLIKSGANFKGLCPFHSEKTPSFHVSAAKQLFHCYGCNEGGDVFAFLMKYRNISFPEALQELANRYRIPLPTRSLSREEQALASRRKALTEITRLAARAYHDYLMTRADAAAARQYLASRELPEETTVRFQLGYAPDEWNFIGRRLPGQSRELLQAAGLLVKRQDKDGWYDRFRKRIMFPIADLTGAISGFGGRILGDGQPKYLNTDRTQLFDKSRTLFGLYQNREAIRKERRCIVVEGNFDMLSLVARGVGNVVAPLGTALTGQHIRVLKGFAEEILLLFDGDSAGIRAAMRSVPLFLAEMVTARIALLPSGHDPDTFIRERGADGLRELIERAVPLADFTFARLTEEFGLTVDGRARIGAEIRRLLAPLEKHGAERTLLANFFSQKLGVAPDFFASGQARGRPQAAVSAKQDEAALPELPAKHRELLEFLINFPSFLEPFRAAGIGDLFASTPWEPLLSTVITAFSRNPAMPPEELLSHISGPGRPLITAILTSPLMLDPAVGQGMLAQLQAAAGRRKRELLQERILAAQQAGDDRLLLALMEEKLRLEQETLEEKSFNSQ